MTLGSPAANRPFSRFSTARRTRPRPAISGRSSGMPVSRAAAALTLPMGVPAGTSYRGRRIGARGTAIFSFHPIKYMTSGEGGMVVTGDDELAERIRRL